MCKRLIKKLFGKKYTRREKTELSPERMAELLEEAISLGYIRVETRENADANQAEM